MTPKIDDYVVIHSGLDLKTKAQCEIAILIDNQWENKIQSYAYINKKIVRTTLKIRRGYLTIIGTYATEEGKKEETEEFYETLQKQINKQK